VSGALLLVAVGGPHVDISSGGDAEDSQASPTPAVAQIVFEADGDIQRIVTAGTTDIGDWITPKAAASGAFEIFAHQDSGDALDVGSSALDSWLSLSTGRNWSITQLGVPGAKSADLTISIRVGGGTLSSGVFTLDATVA